MLIQLTQPEQTALRGPLSEATAEDRLVTLAEGLSVLLLGVGGPAGGGGGSNGLLTGLAAYWSLEEAAGLTRQDATAANLDLTDHGTATQGAGKVGNCAAFDGLGTQYLSRASAAALSPGNADFSLSCWVKFDDVASGVMVTKRDGAGTNYEYRLGVTNLKGPGNRITFDVSADGTTTTTVVGSQALTTGTWYHVAAWHDATNDLIGVVVNNGTVATASHAGGVFQGTADFEVGRDNFNAFTLAGAIDELGAWALVLSAAKITALYNAGAGLAYGSFT